MFDRKTYMKTYMKAYQQKPEFKEQQRAYRQTPEYKEREKANRKRYLGKPEVKERLKTWRKVYSQKQEVKERKNAHMRIYNQKPEVKERVRTYNKTHRKLYLTRPGVREHMSAYITRYSKARYDNNPFYRTRKKIHTRLVEAIKRYGAKKNMPMNQYGIDYRAIAQHLGEPPQDGQKYVVDHIRPLCSFDFGNPEEIKQAFLPENHGWLPEEENLAKVSADRAMSIGYGGR